jgi:hypothetical protein
MDPYEATSSRVDLGGNVPSRSIRNLDPIMIEPIMTLADIAARKGWPVPLLTDGQRDFNPVTGKADIQFHKLGLAIDSRTNHLDEGQLTELVQDLRKELPPAFNIDASDHGTGRHLHIEYDTPATKALMEALPVEMLSESAVSSIQTMMTLYLGFGGNGARIADVRRLTDPIGYAVDFNTTGMDSDRIQTMKDQLDKQLPSGFKVKLNKGNAERGLYVQYKTDMSVSELEAMIENVGG